MRKSRSRRPSSNSGPGRTSVEIPITDLRRYFEYISGRREDEDYQIPDDADSSLGFARMFVRSKEHFGRFPNLEEDFFDPHSPRKRQGVNSGVISLFEEVHGKAAQIRVRENGNDLLLNDIPYYFRYINRELNPMRTTNKNLCATTSDGRPSRSTGLGGMDYIAKTTSGSPHPILGEIKSKETELHNGFIQLAMYLSEMATVTQIDRANNNKTFKTKLSYQPGFELHVLVTKLDLDDNDEIRDLKNFA